MPTQHEAAVPIHDRDEIHEAVSQRDVGDVTAPHLIGAIDRQTTQQVRIHAMANAWQRGLFSRVNGRDPHDPHQPLQAFTVERLLRGREFFRHLAAAEERRLQILLVESTHQLQVLSTLAGKFVVVGAARKAQQLTLPNDAQAAALWLDTTPPVTR